MRSALLLAGLAWLGLTAPVQAAAPPNAGAEQLTQSGKDALRRGDARAAVTAFNQAVRLGSSDAAISLGLMQFLGQGVATNPKGGCDLFEAAANAGVAAGQFALGNCFHEGKGRARDYGRSAQLYLAASEQGHLQALCALGLQYARGLGVPKDEALGFRSCRTAAEADLPEAQFALGDMYWRGIGGQRNAREAAKWFSRAAGQGHREAMFNLGVMSQRGEGVPLNLDDAAQFFRSAAQRGQRAAAMPVGDYYFAKSVDPATRAVHPDAAADAFFWYSIAASEDPSLENRKRAAERRAMLLAMAPEIEADAVARLQRFHRLSRSGEAQPR
jgi:TPR repeat protein